MPGLTRQLQATTQSGLGAKVAAAANRPPGLKLWLGDKVNSFSIARERPDYNLLNKPKHINEVFDGKDLTACRVRVLIAKG